MTDVVDPQPSFEETFHPRNSVNNAIKTATLTGTGGLLVAAVQNTMTRLHVGPLGVFTRFGGTVGVFAAMGGTYAFLSSASANLREKEDPYNHFWGGLVAGMIRGAVGRTMAGTIGNGLFLGSLLAAVNFTGGSLIGDQKNHPDEGRWPTKEEIRKRFRRPFQETINEVGEGRGIYGPGYEERRKQRLKDNYGIEVPEPFYKSSS